MLESLLETEGLILQFSEAREAEEESTKSDVAFVSLLCICINQ